MPYSVAHKYLDKDQAKMKVKSIFSKCWDEALHDFRSHGRQHPTPTLVEEGVQRQLDCRNGKKRRLNLAVPNKWDGKWCCRPIHFGIYNRYLDFVKLVDGMWTSAGIEGKVSHTFIVDTWENVYVPNIFDEFGLTFEDYPHPGRRP